MKKIYSILAVLGLLCSLNPAHSQYLSNRGKDFWVGFGHHQYMETSGTYEMVLYFSAEQPANVTVTITGTTWIRNYSVPANTVIVSDFIPKGGANDARLISLPCSFVPAPCGGEGIFGRSIHIVSDVPIVAYAHIYGSASSGASMLMPVETWGHNYITLNSKQVYGSNCYSWAYAIAQQDNTVIEVTPSQVTRSGRPANVPYTVTLNRGEIYQLMAGPETGDPKPELSGTKIRSIANSAGECYPIAVFAGSSRTRNAPAACGAPIGGDNDNQQCFPSQAWGKRYLTAPTSNSTTASTPMWNTYKIAIKEPTNVYRNGTLLTTLIANSYYEIHSNQPEYITADKPVQVAQFMHSGPNCYGGSGVGDPEMMFISPIEQGIKRIGFYRNDEEAITVNYLTLIIPTAGVASLRIDNSPAFDHSYPHPQLPGYTVVIKRWSGAKAQAIAYSDSAFTAITYGLGSVESYGYNAGTLINNLSAVGSIFNSSDTSGTVTSHPFTCDNTPMRLSVLLGYSTPPTRLVWRLSQVAGLSPNIDVTDNSPTPTGSEIVNGLTYTKFSLPDIYEFADPGIYTIPLLVTHPSVDNCNNTELVYFEIEVKGRPVTDFSWTHTGCISDPVQFTAPTTSVNGFNISQYSWSFPGGATANEQNPSHTFSSTGNQAVNLHLVSEEGCVLDTLRTVPVFSKPVASINAAPLNICEGGTINYSGTATFGGSAPVNSYYWDFGTSTSTALGPHTITYPAAGQYTIKHTQGVSTACVSDTVTRVVNVYAKPYTTFSYPAGCLPASGTVQFTSDPNTSPDGQAIASQTWNFGDPASGANNTSTLANPTHTYPSFGNYTITYSVTSVNGCTKDTTVNATFNLEPTFAWPALTALCESVTGTVSVATASVTNGVSGTGVYSGPGTDAAGNFNPSVAGPGTHTLSYTYTTTANCTAVRTNTIVVYPKSLASFTLPGGGCLPATGVAQFNYDGPPTPGLLYSWNFGDPASGANNTSTLPNPQHTYSNTGTYTIKLTVTNANGCTDDSTITQPFSVTPALNYPVLTPVCVNASPVSVATATVTNGVTGTGVYSGTGVNAAGTFDPSVAGTGSHIITYTFTSTGGCVATRTSTIVVNAKPNASFSITPATGCLPVTGQVQFAYNGTATPGLTYVWDFDDPNATAANPNSSTIAGPSHNYTNTGTYDIKLSITNTNTCVDDTVITKTFSVTPNLTYPALTAVCENAPASSVATATVTNGVTGTGVYSGTGVTSAGMFDPAVAGPGTHPITYTFTSTGGCVATRTSNIIVNAKPNASFSITPATGCLPVTGQVQFAYNGPAAPGLTYLWDFDDPNATPSNPNSSTIAGPSHTYTNTGTYDIKLSVTNSNTCVDDTVITKTLSVTPDLNYPALSAVCESAPASSVATATVTNGVTGTGVYSGTGVTSAGMFDPAVAGPGTHPITYTFTSTGGCVATRTSNIVVNAKPAAAFTVSSDICLNEVAQITPSAGTGITQWNWTFGDNTNAQNNNSNPFTHPYTAIGDYQVTLITENANGCTNTAQQPVSVHAVPVADFTMPQSICLPNAKLQFQNASTVADNEPLSYSWDFGDPASGANNASGDANPYHIYTSANSYTIKLTASTQFGCSNVTSKTFSSFFNKPDSGFVVMPAAVCQGTPVSFITPSQAPGSPDVSYTWYFGDGSAPLTADSPSKIFDNPGVYNVKLLVTSTEGCVSDTGRQAVTIYLQPDVDAGSSFVLPFGATVSVLATSNSNDLDFSWSPATNLSNPTILNPTLQANGDLTYTLTAMGDGGCTDSDFFTVKVMKPVNVPNAFSPNGDGINENWRLDNLTDYPGATVQVFNRHGQVVFKSTGYATPWDGNSNGKPLPVGTYYYVIELKSGFPPLNGPVSIIR